MLKIEVVLALDAWRVDMHSSARYSVDLGTSLSS